MTEWSFLTNHAMASDFNGKIIEEFRTNEGRVGGPFEGAPILLLHSIGARSGQERVNPMTYQRLDGDSVAVFGSKTGAPTNPDWYYNLLAHPDASVEVGVHSYPVRARVARGDERERIWTTQKVDYPDFADFELKCERQIPVVILEKGG